jgi:hypothetical protein
MAIRAQKLQILGPVVEPVAIDVVDVQHDGPTEPGCLDIAAGSLAAIRAYFFEHGPSELERLLPTTFLSLDQQGVPLLLARASSMPVAPARRLAQEVGSVDPEPVDRPADVGVVPSREWQAEFSEDLGQRGRTRQEGSQPL